MQKLYWTLICTDCKIEQQFTAPTFDLLKVLAKFEGWIGNRSCAICPDCQSLDF